MRMSGEGGCVDDRTVAVAAGLMRGVLCLLDAGRLSCSAAYRNRLEGAVVAMEALTGGDPDPPEVTGRVRDAGRASRG